VRPQNDTLSRKLTRGTVDHQIVPCAEKPQRQTCAGPGPAAFRALLRVGLSSTRSFFVVYMFPETFAPVAAAIDRIRLQLLINNEPICRARATNPLTRIIFYSISFNFGNWWRKSNRSIILWV